MKIRDLEKIFEDAHSYHIQYNGVCNDCGKGVTVNIDMADDGKITIKGGAVFEAFDDANKKSLKCDECYKKDSLLRQECEVYSRVVGYLRPVNQWNKGKKEEFEMRKNFVM